MKRIRVSSLAEQDLDDMWLIMSKIYFIGSMIKTVFQTSSLQIERENDVECQG